MDDLIFPFEFEINGEKHVIEVPFIKLNDNQKEKVIKNFRHGIDETDIRLTKSQKEEFIEIKNIMFKVIAEENNLSDDSELISFLAENRLYGISYHALQRFNERRFSDSSQNPELAKLGALINYDEEKPEEIMIELVIKADTLVKAKTKNDEISFTLKNKMEIPCIAVKLYPQHLYDHQQIVAVITYIE